MLLNWLCHHLSSHSDRKKPLFMTELRQPKPLEMRTGRCYYMSLKLWIFWPVFKTSTEPSECSFWPAACPSTEWGSSAFQWHIPKCREEKCQWPWITWCLLLARISFNNHEELWHQFLIWVLLLLVSYGMWLNWEVSTPEKYFMRGTLWKVS